VWLDQQFVGFGGNWIEIAYGTSAGTVCIIVQHPETLGQGPQLFQTFSVHCSPVIRVMISEKHLVSGIFCLVILQNFICTGCCCLYISGIFLNEDKNQNENY